MASASPGVCRRLVRSAGPWRHHATPSNPPAPQGDCAAISRARLVGQESPRPPDVHDPGTAPSQSSSQDRRRDQRMISTVASRPSWHRRERPHDRRALCPSTQPRRSQHKLELADRSLCESRNRQLSASPLWPTTVPTYGTATPHAATSGPDADLPHAAGGSFLPHAGIHQSEPLSRLDMASTGGSSRADSPRHKIAISNAAAVSGDVTAGGAGRWRAARRRELASVPLAGYPSVMGSPRLGPDSLARARAGRCAGTPPATGSAPAGGISDLSQNACRDIAGASAPVAASESQKTTDPDVGVARTAGPNASNGPSRGGVRSRVVGSLPWSAQEEKSFRALRLERGSQASGCRARSEAGHRCVGWDQSIRRVRTQPPLSARKRVGRMPCRRRFLPREATWNAASREDVCDLPSHHRNPPR